MRRLLSVVAMFLVVLWPAGCGDDNPEDPGDPTPPEVVSSTPPSGSENLRLLQAFEVEFSEAMDPGSFHQGSVRIEDRGPSLHLSYDEISHTLRAQPESLLASDADLRFMIEGAASQDGGELEIFSIEFSTGAFDCEHLADRFEPNEDIDSAVPIELDTLVPALSTCSEDVDIFSFTVAEESMVTARVYVTHEENDPEADYEHTSWAIHWYYAENMSLTTLGAWAITGQETPFHYSFLPGTYFVKLFGHYEEVDVIYDLILEASPACNDDIYEDNDFREFAAEITPGVHMLRGCYVDTDWYRLPVETGQILDVQMDAFDAIGLRYLALSEPGGDSISSGTVQDNPLSGQMEITADGEAMIRVQFWSDDVDYELSIGLGD